MDLEDILGRRAKFMRKFLDYYAKREARPRVACSECQFEYVEEDGCSNCGQGKVQG